MHPPLSPPAANSSDTPSNNWYDKTKPIHAAPSLVPQIPLLPSVALMISHDNGILVCVWFPALTSSFFIQFSTTLIQTCDVTCCSGSDSPDYWPLYNFTAINVPRDGRLVLVFLRAAIDHKLRPSMRLLQLVYLTRQPIPHSWHYSPCLSHPPTLPPMATSQPVGAHSRVQKPGTHTRSLHSTSLGPHHNYLVTTTPLNYPPLIFTGAFYIAGLPFLVPVILLGSSSPP